MFPRFKAVVFVHGCYWHSHGCHRSTIPKTRKRFWKAKFATNKSRDVKNNAELLKLGWRVLTVWECALLGKTARPIATLTKRIITWLNSTKRTGEIG